MSTWNINREAFNVYRASRQKTARRAADADGFDATGLAEIKLCRNARVDRRDRCASIDDRRADYGIRRRLAFRF